jgi:corrinoid protein of di/trimethylamine methyltransferase
VDAHVLSGSPSAWNTVVRGCGRRAGTGRLPCEEEAVSDEIFEAMAQSIVDGEPGQAAALARKAVAEGIDPLDALNRGFVVGVNTVGKAFGCGDAFLPDLVMAGEAMQAAVAVLDPELAKRGERRTTLGNVVVGTIKGDIHDIGKTLVATMLSAGGFQVHDLGVDVPPATFAEKARLVNAVLVGVSALLTTTMVNQKQVIEALDDLGLRPKIKVMVGGAPVTRAFATQIGAEGYAQDAVAAVAEAKRLLQGHA